MKKHSTILVILTIIVLVHAVILFSCMYSEAGALPESEAKGPAVPEKPVPGGNMDNADAASLPVINPVVLDPAPSVSADASAQNAVPPPEIPYDPHFGEPFEYRYAVQGNIASLPGSVSASSGILVDLNTRNVLWAKNARNAYPIASMTKIMTCLLAYEDILAGKYSLDTPVKVTAAASRIGGSQVYLDPRETFKLGELMKATSIKSANDAAYLIAEFIGGGAVRPFVDRMNARARELKMANTRFYNPNGLPGKAAKQDNVSSPEGMARLAEVTLRHKQLMDWASTRLDTFREKGQKGYMMIKNHNYLLPGSSEAAPGVDGLKTGFINRSGFCLTATCLRDGRRMVAVVTGYPRRRDRDMFVRRLLDWGYARAADPATALKRDRTLPAVKPQPKKTSLQKNAVQKKPVQKKTAQPKKTVQKKAPAKKAPPQKRKKAN